MGMFDKGLDKALSGALEGSDGAIDHEVQGPGERGIAHEVTGRLTDAVRHEVTGGDEAVIRHEVSGGGQEVIRHEVAGDDTPVIRHHVAEVGQLSLQAAPLRVEPVAVQVPPVLVRVGVEALSRVRLRLPAAFTVRFSLFGREIARLDLSGGAEVVSEAADDPDAVAADAASPRQLT